MGFLKRFFRRGRKMRVRMKKRVTIRGVEYADGKEYDVEESLGRWMLSHDIAEEVRALPPVEYKSAYEKLLEILGCHHVVEIYGHEGTGKTNLVYHIALEHQQMGGEVFFFDTEGKLPYEMADKLKYYEYVDDLKTLTERIRTLAETGPSENALLIIDSIGWPLYVAFKELKEQRRQFSYTAWQELLPPSRWAVRFARGIPSEKKGEWIKQNRNLAIMTDQPVWIGREQELGPMLKPFGGKLVFLPMLVVHSEATENSGEFSLRAYKSIRIPKGKEIARFKVTSEGVKIEWRI